MKEVDGCEHTRLLVRPLASAVVLVWIWPISWMRFNERRIGAEARLLLGFNEPSARLWTSDCHGALWMPNDTSSPCRDGAAEAIVFRPVWWNIQATPFCHPGVASGPAFVISLEGKREKKHLRALEKVRESLMKGFCVIIQHVLREHFT